MASHLRSFFKSGLWTFFAKSSSSVLSLVQSMLLARILPQTEFGLYLMSMSLIWGISTLVQWGSGPSIITRLQARPGFIPNQRGEIFARLKLMMVIISLCAIAILFAPTTLLHTDFPIELNFGERSLLVTYLALHALHFFVPEALRGLHQISWASIFTGPLPHLPGCLWLVYLWRAGEPVSIAQIFSVLCWAWGASLLLSLVVLHFSTRGRDARTLPAVVPGLSQNFRLQTSMALFQLVTFFSVQSDLWLINYLAHPNQVAIYGVAQKLLMLFTFTPLVLGTAMLAQLSQLHASGKHRELSQLMRRSAVISSIVALSMAAIFYFMGEFIVTKLFGARYLVSLDSFYILAAGQVLAMAFGPLGFYLMMTGHQAELLKITVFSTACALALGVIIFAAGVRPDLAVSTGVSVGLLIQTISFFRKARKSVQAFSAIAGLRFWSHDNRHLRKSA